MFVGYENFSTYFVETSDAIADVVSNDEGTTLPAEYRLEIQWSDPWFNKSACDDFVILAEFYELEGPTPRIIIPPNLKIKDDSFCLNSFVVRLMSVDHQRTQGEKFAVCEDAQVILSQFEHGLFAYVHHFTLYDLAGRGFVRPFCLAYVTPDYDKLMMFYDELSNEFARVSQLFKAGNRLKFLRSMTHRLSDLQYTRERYLEQQLDDEIVESDGQASLANISKSIEEVKSILDIIGELVEKDSAQQTCSAGHDPYLLNGKREASSKDAGDFETSRKEALGFETCDSVPCETHDCHQDYTPQLLNAVGCRVPLALGTLEELCERGSCLGIDSLHRVYDCFRRDLATLMMEKEDSRSLDPGCGLLTVGGIASINFLRCLQTRLDESANHIELRLNDLNSSPQSIEFRPSIANMSVVSIADHVERLSSSSFGFGLLHFVYQFSMSPHLIFSLVIGRPVIILGSLFLEKEIRAIVGALQIFIPGCEGECADVTPWSTSPLTFADLSRIKLCGLGRPDKKSFDFMVSRNLTNYVTILNLDKKSLWAPRYEGVLLNQISASKENFKSDAAYIAYIYSKLFEVARRSFVYFHSFVIRKSASHADSIHSRAERFEWNKASENVTSCFKMAADDLAIVKYFVEVVKTQQQLNLIKPGCADEPWSVRLNHRHCQQFAV